MTTYRLPIATWAARTLKKLIGREPAVPTAIDDLSEEKFMRRLTAWEEEIDREETVKLVEKISAEARSHQPAVLPETVSELLPEESITPGRSQEDTASSRERLLLLPHQAIAP
jgi:hypothetical protein